jgi:hypothetical protein
MVNIADVVRVPLGEPEITDCIGTAMQLAPRIGDRADLHARDGLERFVNVLLGEVAERMVLAWLHGQGKQAEPASDKRGDGPDAGHDLLLRRRERTLRCSVKSSLSAMHDLPRILSEFTLATKRGELRHVNIQVYFWLDLHARGGHRVTVPSLERAAIIGWAGLREIQHFGRYATEVRQSPAGYKLQQMNPMADLLPLID